MSDFMQWLYAHYIKPYMDSAPKGDYDFWLDLLRSDLTPDGQEALEKSMECVAVQTFLLGLRTGEGLAGAKSAPYL